MKDGELCTKRGYSRSGRWRFDRCENQIQDRKQGEEIIRKRQVESQYVKKKVDL